MRNNEIKIKHRKQAETCVLMRNITKTAPSIYRNSLVTHI